MSLRCVFWDEQPRKALRATWFYKGPTDAHFEPYEEELCTRLEEEYQRTWRHGSWHKRIDIGRGEALVVHSPNAISHFVQPETSAGWVTVPDSLLRPRAVKRSADAFVSAGIDELDEPDVVDHLVFVAPGIGSVCDFKLRNVIECVDSVRDIARRLLAEHWKEWRDDGSIHRVEFLPVEWHSKVRVGNV